MATPRRYGLLFVAVFLIAVAVRTIPLLSSPLPAPHTFAYVPPTIETVETGQLVVGGRTDHFLWHAWLAQLALLFDVEVTHLLRPINAVVSAMPVVLAVAVTRRLCAHWGWPARRTWVAAGLAGLLLGVNGLYLHRSVDPHPNTIGLFVLPLFVIVLYRAHTSGRRSWWVAAAALLVLLPPLHVFVSLMAAIIVTMLAAIVVVRERYGPRALPVVGVTALLWVYVPGFHYLLRHLTPTRIAYTERVTELPGLYVAWLVLGVFGTVWLLGANARTQRRLGWGLFALLFGLLALNAVHPVFLQAQPTSTPLLVGVAPLVVLAVLAVWRLPDATQATRVGPPLVAIIVGTLVIEGVTLSSLPSLAHLTTAERASYFLHFPVMVLAGMGGAAILVRISGPHRDSLRSATTVVIVLCAAVSIPVALAGVPVTPYENSVSPPELAATVFAAEHTDGEWTSDSHLHDIGVRIGPDPAAPEHALVADPTPPVWRPTHEWMRNVADRPPDCAVVLKASWTTDGAMFYPLAPESLEPDAYLEHRETANVVYASGADDPISLTVPRGHASSC